MVPPIRLAFALLVGLATNACERVTAPSDTPVPAYEKKPPPPPPGFP